MPLIFWLCGHCGKIKSTETDICLNCHRFPTKEHPSKKQDDTSKEQEDKTCH